MLSDNDLELLSAYIDGALSQSERTALEARLAADADLRRELERLRATVALVNSLPTLAAPRDFTLTPRMVRRPPTILTSAAFSALSAAAAVVLLVVGAALFTTSMRSPQSDLNANQVALAPTTIDETIEDGAQAEMGDVARQQTAGAGVLATSIPQLTQELPRDLLPAPTGTGEEAQLYAARESATLAEEADNFAGAAADAALSQQQDSEGAGALQSAVAAPTEATQLRMAEPSQPPASAASGIAEAQPPAPGEAPVVAQAPSETASPSPTLAPTGTPTLTPSVTPSPTATPTETATLMPSPMPTATPQTSVLGEAGAAGVGIGLIIVALVLLLAAVVTTILRRTL